MVVWTTEATWDDAAGSGKQKTVNGESNESGDEQMASPTFRSILIQPHCAWFSPEGEVALQSEEQTQQHHSA